MRKDEFSINRAWVKVKFSEICFGKRTPYKKKVNFSLFSSAKGYSFHLFNLLYFSLKLLIQHSSSKFRAWVLRFLILEIRKASFINATWPIIALSSLILGFSEGCVLVYRYTKEGNINELRHNSMYGYENKRNSLVYRYTRTAPFRARICASVIMNI